MFLDPMPWSLADLYIFGNASVLEGLTIWQAVQMNFEKAKISNFLKKKKSLLIFKMLKDPCQCIILSKASSTILRLPL